MSSLEALGLENAAANALALANQTIAEGRTAEISDEAVQRLLTAATRLFAAKLEGEQRFFLPVTARDAVTPTEAATLVTELLRAVNLNLFDLSMWAARPRDHMANGGPD